MYLELALLELAVWFGLPAWIANATPVLGGGGRPIDGGKIYKDGRRVLGDGKTIRGFIVGVVLGILTGAGQMLAAPYLHPLLAQYVTVTPDMEAMLYMQLPVAILMSVGALTGDIIGSFIKRRVNIKSGDPAPFMDQLGFIVVALIFVYPLVHPEAIYVIILILVTLGIHWISNALGYLLGLKKHPW